MSITSVEAIESETPWNSEISTHLSSTNFTMANDNTVYPFVGEYFHIRSKLDYSYHSYYPPERQLLQDSIIQLMMNTTIIHEKNTDPTINEGKPIICSTPASNPWIVFTAGAMGAGKTHTIRILQEKKVFPLEAFVSVDPDEIRRHLPEFQLYVQNNPAMAGELTRKEAGYISEILTWVALDQAKNVLVDGSLRDHRWYRKYFGHLRQRYIDLNIAILHVTASKEDVLERALKRGLDTGRIVPVKTLELVLQQVPTSVQILSPLVDFFCELYNGSNKISTETNKQFTSIEDSQDVQIVTPGISWESFQNRWEQHCRRPGNNNKAFNSDKLKGVSTTSLVENKKNTNIDISIAKTIEKKKSRL